MKPPNKLVLLSMFFLNLTFSFAQQLTLVKDFNPSVSQFIPNEVGYLGNIVFFTIDDRDHGKELWRSDGTSGGTHLVKDIYSGISDSNPRLFKNFKNQLYFVATDPLHGSELWKTDGTEAGTQVAIESVLGPTGYIYDFEPTNNKIFIIESSNAGGEWHAQASVSDGTQMGTTQISIPKLPFIRNLEPLNDKIIFTGSYNGKPDEVWFSDGTSEGTFQVPNLKPKSDKYLVLGSKAYFVAEESYYNKEGIYSTDGTIEGTKRISQSNSARNLMISNNHLYYTVFDYPNQWIVKSDGTENGSFAITPVFLSILSMFVHGSTVYFSGSNGNGYELWKTDGSAATTSMIKDIEPGALSSYPENFSVYNNVIYFKATTTANGTEIWRTDGTTDGTKLLKEVVTGSANATTFILPNPVNSLIFLASEQTNGGQPWVSDGTTNGTSIIKLISKGNSSTDFWHPIVSNNKLVFRVFKDFVGFEMNISDGTSSGTQLGYPGIRVESGPFPSTDSNVVFTGVDSSQAWFLYFTDGTTEGTRKVKLSPYITLLGVWKNNAYFTLPGVYTDQYTFWKSDGTDSGTSLIKNINGNFSFYNSNPELGINGESTGDGFYFLGEDINGQELWRSDGTSTGTKMVKDINHGFDSSNPSIKLIFGDKVVFVANDGVIGMEPWITDGSESGTFNLADVNAGSRGSSFYSFVAYGNEFYFIASNSSGYQLWKSNGTKAGTSMVRQLSNGFDYLLGSLTNYKGKLIFSAYDAAHGVELWEADANGFRLLSDLYQGPQNSYPSSFTQVHGTLFFRAFDKDGGRTTWSTDGTAANTKPLEFPYDFYEDTYQLPIYYLNNQFLTTGNDKVYGRELFSFSLATVTEVSKEVEGISVFPNPANSGTVYVSGIDSNEVYFSLFDLRGAQVKQFSTKSSNGITSFDVNELTSGFYIIKVTCGNKVVIRQLVIR